jgi:hypothetical protein
MLDFIKVFHRLSFSQNQGDFLRKNSFRKHKGIFKGISKTDGNESSMISRSLITEY